MNTRGRWMLRQLRESWKAKAVRVPALYLTSSRLGNPDLWEGMLCL